MKKSKRIQPIAALAKHQERKAAEQLGKANQLLLSLIKQLEHLQQYKQDYLNQFHEHAQTGLSGIQLQRFHQFIMQLDKAIAEQKQRIEQCHLQIKDSRKNWTGKNSRHQAVDKLRVKMQKAEQHHADKAEQKVADDLHHVLKSPLL